MTQSDLFEQWINMVEAGAYGSVSGIMHCSLEHRTVLREAFRAGLAAGTMLSPLDAEPESAQCTVPPAGWYCTRGRGHRGPCAARPGADTSKGKS